MLIGLRSSIQLRALWLVEAKKAPPVTAATTSDRPTCVKAGGACSTGQQARPAFSEGEEACKECALSVHPGHGCHALPHYCSLRLPVPSAARSARAGRDCSPWPG